MFSGGWEHEDMRLWSVHPRYFDRQALTACWREGLLAQQVLTKTSGGYSSHPQLQRFRAAPDPEAAMWTFLHGIVDEADARGYRFARDKIHGSAEPALTIAVTSGQRDFEWQHLCRKLEARSPDVALRWRHLVEPRVHPLFRVVDGAVESWERGTGRVAGRTESAACFVSDPPRTLQIEDPLASL
jgi:hypothetical protein